MKILTGTRLLVLSGLLSLTLISGCGNSTSSKSASTSENVFYSTGVLLSNPDPNNSDLRTLWASGYNGYGQLANGSLSNIYSFGIINSLYSKDADKHLLVRNYSTGANHILAFDNHSTIWSWGSNFSGRLGYGEALATTGSSAYSAIPAQVTIPGLTQKAAVSSVAAGWKHSLAVIGSQVYAWGDNTYGQLGVGSKLLPNTTWAYPIEVTVPGTVAEVAAGGSHSVARTTDGKVYAWGSNAYAQCGNDVVLVNNTAAYFTLPIKVTFPPNRTAQKIVAAGSYTLAVLDDNKIYGWGYGLYGQLGTGSILWRSAGTVLQGDLQPVQLNIGDVTGPGTGGEALVLPPGQYQKVAPGQSHVLALVRDPNNPADKGQVYAWGDNQKGQLGIADAYGQAMVSFWVGFAGRVTVLDQILANPNPPKGSDGSGITDVYAIGNTSYAKINGLWYGWGDNNWGQLGQPVKTDAVSYILIPQKLEVP